MVRILFLCVGNACRSQMAEGWTRHVRGGEMEAYSAGTESRGIDPLAVKAMAEAGVDISGQRSKSLDEVRTVGFDWVITLCDSARETCPVFPGNVKRTHVDFDDPPKLAAGTEDEEEKLKPYRRVRDEIRTFIESLEVSDAERGF